MSCTIRRRDLLKLGGQALVLGAAASVLPGCRARGERTLSRMRLGYLPITDHLTVIAAERTMFQHLRLEPTKFSSWPELAEALKAGKVEAAFALTPIALALRQKGAPLKLVLLGHRNGSVLTVAPDVAALNDLRGKSVAIPSRFSTHNLLLRRLLAREGLDADKDLQVVEMPPPEMVQALATHRIAGFIVAEPFGAQAELKGIGKVLALSKDIWPGHICCALVVREDVVAGDPAAVQELVDALIASGQFAHEHPEEAAAASRPYLGQAPAVVLHVLTQPPGRVTSDDLLPTLADLSATQDDMLRYRIAAERVELTSFLDDRYARSAYRK